MNPFLPPQPPAADKRQFAHDAVYREFFNAALTYRFTGRVISTAGGLENG
jgi:hypothetical protein